MSRKYDVTLCGYYGFGNLGDELLARSIIDLLKESGVENRRIALLSADPEKSSRELGVDCYDRWDIRTLRRVLKRSETLLYGGGGLFQDSTSIRSCFYYWSLARLAGLTGTKTWMFGQSVGPLKSSFARFMAKNAISGCAVRGVRDSGSAEILKRWGLSSLRSPDPVLSVKYRCDGEYSSCTDKILLVNVRPWGDDLAGKLTYELKRVDPDLFNEFVFVALAEEDEILAKGLLDRYPLPGVITRVERVKNPEDIRRVWCSATAAIGMRLHFCILSSVFSVPCVAVPYDPKVSYFSEQSGMPCWKPGSPLPEFPFKRGDVHSPARVRLKEEIQEIFDRCLKIVLGEL